MVYDLVPLKTLKALSKAGTVRRAQAVVTDGGFAVQFTYGLTTKTLQAKRGHPRIFKTLDALAKTVRGLGVPRLEADLADWHPEQRAENDGLDVERARKQLRKAITTIRNRAANLSPDDAQQFADQATQYARMPEAQR